MCSPVEPVSLGYLNTIDDLVSQNASIEEKVEEIKKSRQIAQCTIAFKMH
jgi:hypothetical protein